MSTYQIETADGSIYEVVTEETETTASNVMPMTTKEALAGGVATALQGLTVGGGDEIVAGGNAVLDKVFGGPGYAARLQQVRDLRDKYKNEVPEAATALEGLSSFALPIFGKAKGALKAAETVGAKGAKTFGQVLKSAAGNVGKVSAAGAGYGAVGGFNEGEGLGERLGKAGEGLRVGGLIGAGLGAAPIAITGGAKAVSSAINTGKQLLSERALNEAAKKTAIEVLEGLGINTQKVGEEAAEYIAAQEALPYVKKKAASNMGRYKTTAEVIGPENNIELASLAQTLETSGGNPVKLNVTRAANERSNKRMELVEAARSEPVKNSLATERIMPVLAKGKAELGAEVKRLATESHKGGEILPVMSAKRETVGQVHRITESGAHVVDVPLMDMVKRFVTAGGKSSKMTLKEIQSFRTEAGEAMERLKNASGQDYSIATAMYAGLDNVEKTALQNGLLKPKTAKLIRQMRDTRALKGELYEGGKTGEALDTQYGRAIKDPEAVAPSLYSTERETKRTLGALRGDKAGRQTLADNFVTNLIDKATPAAEGESRLLPATFARYMRVNRGEADLLLGKKAATNINAALEDIGSELRTKSLASQISKNKSYTTEGVTSGKALAGTIQAALSGGIRIPFITAISDAALKGMRTTKAALVEQALAEFALRPEVAAELVKPATKTNVENVLALFERFMSEAVNTIPQGTPGATRQVLTSNEEYREKKDKERPTAPTSDSYPSMWKMQKKKVNMISDIKDIELPRIVTAVIEAESAGDPNALSPVGAQGLMQIMPKTFEEEAQRLGIENGDPLDPETNVLVGTSYLQQLITKYNGSIPLALMAYNWGMGRVDKLIEAKGSRSPKDLLPYAPEETQKYVTKIVFNLNKGSANV